MSGQSHDKYGKQVLLKAFPHCFVSTGKQLRVEYGKGGYARIDGLLNDEIAIEIESRVSKQIRGALVDLISHEAKRKLLILIPAHTGDIEKATAQCEYILRQHLHERDFLVVALQGTGGAPHNSRDVATIRKALHRKSWVRKADKYSRTENPLSQKYYVYDNWRVNRATVHAADCPYCKAVQGSRNHTDSGLNGKWYGPFSDSGEAAQAANRMGRQTVRICNGSASCKALHK